MVNPYLEVAYWKVVIQLKLQDKDLSKEITIFKVRGEKEPKHKESCFEKTSHTNICSFHFLCKRPLHQLSWKSLRCSSIFWLLNMLFNWCRR